MNQVNRSFSRRLSRRILVVLTLTITAVALLVTMVSGIVLRRMTLGYFLTELQVVNEWIEKRLKGVEVASANTVDGLSSHLDSPEHVFDAFKGKLEANDPYLLGFGAAFEPYYFPDQGKWFEAYVYRQDDRIDFRQIGGEQHDYFNKEWYRKTLDAEIDYWSDPYFDDAVTSTPMCSYFRPILDMEGRRVGVYGADFSLDWLYGRMQEIDDKVNEYLPLKPRNADRVENKGLRAYNIIIDGQGIYIYHPERQRILKDDFFDNIRESPDTLFNQLSRNLAAGEKGYQKIKMDKTISYIFYTSIKNTDWRNAVVVSLNGFLIPNLVIVAILLTIIALGLLIAYWISRISIQRSTRPLQLLADSADQVAKGNFQAPLPELKYEDEIHRLRDSFGNMQASLVRYIDQLKATTAQKAAIESEINIARDIQMSRIPTAFPKRSDIDVYASITPAKTVGGDLYDFLVRDRKFIFCIGDVSGKGVPAALLMMVTKSLFRAYACDDSSPDRIVAQMNRDLCENNDKCMFVTLFVGVLDLESRRLQYCNAGHEAPILIGTEARKLPVEPALPAGAVEETVYRTQTASLEPQTTLLLYTDGLSEAMNTDDECFGRERIFEVVNLAAKMQQTAPKALVERMTGAVNDFVGDTEQSDDLTMLCLRV